MQIKALSSIKKYLIVAAVATTGLSHAQLVSQNVNFPKGILWQMMPQVTFNAKDQPSGTPDQRMIAEAIWRKELSQVGEYDHIQADGSHDKGKLPSFILLGTASFDFYQFIFTSNRSFGACEPPPNGPFSDPKLKAPMYSTCDLRIVRTDSRNKQRVVRQVPNFCHLYIDNPPDQYLSNNHTEMAFDAWTKTVYFRVIQYGKRLPECDRRLTVG
jgi:hypothetical protein